MYNIFRGYKVRGTVRSLDNSSFLTKLPNAAVNLDLVVANLEDPVSLEPAFDGVEFVIHVAGPYTLSSQVYSGKDPVDSIHVPIVTGTNNILELCHSTESVKKLIFTSCTCALTDEFNPSHEYNETDWNSMSSFNRNLYAYCKITAERAAYRYAQRPDCTFTIASILPSTVLGDTCNLIVL